jgi:hypothetical protein
VKHIRGKRILIPVASILALLVLAAFWLCYEKQEGIKISPEPHELFAFDPFDFQLSEEADAFLQPGVTPRAILGRIAAKNSEAAERWKLDEVKTSHTHAFSPKYGILRVDYLIGELRDIPNHQLPEWLDSLLSYGQLSTEFGYNIEASTPLKRITGPELDIPLRDGDTVIFARKHE